MTQTKGIFRPDIIKLNLDHLLANEGIELPKNVEYRVPPELANKFKDAKGHLKYRVDPGKTTTLAQPIFASLLYMDVGRWGGDGPGATPSDSTWDRRRDFGLVCGRLTVLYTYKRGGEKPEVDTKAVKDVASSPEFAKIKPLLDHLSSRERLGRVVVTRALLGRSDLAEPPTDQKIHVFLGDLHSPVMTERNRTHSGVDPRPAEYTMMPAPPSPYSPGTIPVMTRQASRHPMLGRYNPGLLVRALLPFVAKLLNMTVDDLNHGSIRKYLTLPMLIENWAAIVAILERVWEETPLDTWPDPDQEGQAEVEHWFEMYHGKGAKGAEIFERAGADLKDWLELLIEYQNGGKTPPIRLAQLGDLFDLWIGLKCAFSAAGAKHTSPGARAFADYWHNETLANTDQRDAIHLLWNFDDYLSPGKKVYPIFLYGNHDNYMGTLFGMHEQFKEEKGLVAQHGHQADKFNCDENAKRGYLLTQAAFAVLAIRELEDPLSALVAGTSGGIGPRLTFTEMALEECVLKPVLAGKTPAMTFVMGHTHEPVLQEIRVLEYLRANPPTSPPPEYTPPPAAAKDHKVQVTVRFLQVDITNDGNSYGAGHWWMLATVRQWSETGAGAPKADVPLFDYRPVNTHEVIPLSGKQGASLAIAVDAGLVIEANAGGDGGDPDGISLVVGSLTYGGTRTIECKGKSRGYKLTFELLWGAIVD